MKSVLHLCDSPRSLRFTFLYLALLISTPYSQLLAVEVTVDTSETPDLEAWGAKAGKLVEEWHPKIAALLASDGFTPPATVKLVFQKDKKGVAATAGNTIYIAAKFVREHPDDYGMVIHELTHVI